MEINPDVFHETPKEDRASRPIKVALEIIAALLLVSMAIAAPVGAAGWRMYQEALAGRAALVSAASSAQRLDFSGTQTNLASAQKHLAAADRYGLVLAPLSALPLVGSDVSSARLMVRSSLQTATALGRLAELGNKVLGILASSGDFDLNDPTLTGGVEAFFRLPPVEREIELKNLAAAPEALASSLSEIDQALAGFKSLPESGYLAPVVQSLSPIISELANVRDRLASAAGLAKLIPSLAGYPEPKKYLLLIQNNTELRPTGGFIGTLGTVTIANAQAKSIELSDVYAIDGVGGEKLTTVPPAPLRKYLSVGKWYLRDANWSPDFPTSASQIVSLYGQETGNKDIDGVLAVDPVLAENLLRIVGNVKIGDSTFTPENVTDEIEFQVEKGFSQKGLPVEQRKDVLLALSAEIFRRILALPPEGWQKVVTALTTALAQKHLLAVSFDETASGFLAERNWMGALAPVTGDYLLAIDANLAALKTDSVINRTVSYSVKPDGNGYLATARLRYANYGGFSWKTTRYRDYARIFVPAGSELVGVVGAMENDKILDPRRTAGRADIVDELGRRSFGAFISVEPGETRELVFNYRLPASVANQIKGNSYSLTVQKQAGTVSVPLTLALDFGKRVTSAVPPEAKENWGDNVYKLSSDLTIDRQFQVGF